MNILRCKDAGVMIQEIRMIMAFWSIMIAKKKSFNRNSASVMIFFSMDFINQ